MMNRLAVLSAAIVVLWSLAPFPAAGEVSGAARVVDGDTLEIGDQRVRLAGIDAPEQDQVCRRDDSEFLCGVMATAWMIERTLGVQVTCTGDRRDRYGRLLGVCYAGDTDLNAALVRDGWAVAFVRYSKTYLNEEAHAKRLRLGMWSGEFQRPVEWRRAKRKPREVKSTEIISAKCSIKGNVNALGQRLYHRPGGRFYQQVRLRPREGDRCFQSEEEALAAGFRAAKR